MSDEYQLHAPDFTWDPNGHQVRNSYNRVVASYFLCPHCGCWCSWSLGAADGRPEACDVCWAQLEAEAA